MAKLARRVPFATLRFSRSVVQVRRDWASAPRWLQVREAQQLTGIVATRSSVYHVSCYDSLRPLRFAALSLEPGLSPQQRRPPCGLDVARPLRAGGKGNPAQQSRDDICGQGHGLHPTPVFTRHPFRPGDWSPLVENRVVAAAAPEAACRPGLLRWPQYGPHAKERTGPWGGS